MNSVLSRIFAFLFLVFNTGCSSLIFGNIKPFEEKSKDYSILDLSKVNPAWVKIASSRSEKKEPSGGDHSHSGESSDVVFRERRLASTISINTACKNYPDQDRKPTLQKLTHDLLLGIFPPESTGSPFTLPTEEERNLILEDTPALRTISKGQINGRDYVIETVVLRSNNCIYDMIYIAKAENFEKNEKDFSNFVSSLHFK